MLQVWFASVDDNSITNHKRLNFSEAVKLTDELERKCRDEKRVTSSEFTVIDGRNNKTLYVGIFEFGSYEFPNIYHQIKENSIKIKVDKRSQADKEYLLEKIEELTPEEFKREEIIDKTLINLDKDKISRLKKWQRVTIYSFTSLVTIAFLILLTVFILEKVQYENVLAEGRNRLDGSEELNKKYEKALLGNEEELLEYLSDKKLSENQEVLLTRYHINEGDYKTATKTMNNDPSKVETMILTDSSYDEAKKITKIKEFNEEYPTNEARYDIAYFEKDYELMLNLPDLDMTIERSKMKTRALIKLGKTDEAKAELKNNNDKELKEVIEKYEVLRAEISTLEEKLEQENKEKKKDKDKIKKLEEELNEKRKEFEEL